MDSRIKKILYFYILILLPASFFGQSYNIDYYGIVSDEIDSNMAKLTSDLYYTQLSEIENFSVLDKRDSVLLDKNPELEQLSSQNLSFFTVIQKETDSDKWITIYHVVDKKNNEEHIKQKTYDSFYKILMESKNILKDTIKSLIENEKPVEYIKAVPQDKNKSFPATVSTESLSGTWIGEESINKIVILRGGRGFIIFKNGASMNVTVNLSETDSTQIIIQQNGKSNASFYPELPRNIALKAAISAEPIKWILISNSENSLTGIKQTLIPQGDSYTSGNLSVEWKKIN